MNSSRRSGTSLVEVLVVIVVFLVGILAIVQIFPGGFRVLGGTQRNEIATALGRAESELLKNHADQLPDAIVPVQYTYSGGTILITAQPERFADDLGPAYSNMGPDGTMYDTGGNAIGNWQFLVGPNIGRRVVGEGKIIPTPRVIGSNYGSLLTLQFAPVVYSPAYTSIFQVYGNDMSKREGDPLADNLRVRPTEYWLSNEDGANAQIDLPVNSGKPLKYTISLTAYFSSGPASRQDFIGVEIDVPASNGQGQAVQLSSVLPSGLLGIDYDSVKVARLFDDVNVTNAGVFTSDPYEFKLLSPQLGLVLFNPAGYNFFIRGGGGRRNPLQGRVSYDVYDWRIIHDEFRVPSMYPAEYRLAIGSLKVSNELGPDQTVNRGLGIQAPDASGVMHNVDLVLEDGDTGGLFAFQEGATDPHLTSFTVNKSLGLVTFLDYDGDPSNGTQALLLLPGASTPQLVTLNNRNLRALYMGKNEFAVQVMKPSAVYTESWTRPGIGHFYLGRSVSGDGLSGNRIYFPPADGGRVVSIGELYYTNGGGEVGPVQLTAKVQTNNMEQGLPYIQVSDYFPDFTGFDYAYTSAVKNVKGASVAVRVLWNPNSFGLTSDPAVNMDSLNKWMQGWRRATVETYLQRGY